MSDKKLGVSKLDESKRKFIKAAVYVAPVVLTLKAVPSHAGTGSGGTTRTTQPGFYGLRR